MSDLENQLRAELHRRAEHAPAGTALAERIVAATRTEPRPVGRRGWPTWTMPLLAAGAVAAIVTGVFVGVSQIRHDASPTTPGLNTGSPTTLHSGPRPTPTTSTTSSRPSPTGATTTAGPPPDNPVGLHNFAVDDITFYGTQDAWAIGFANCLSGSGERCAAMVRTTDGGQSWHSMPPPPIEADGIRFATDNVGYAFNATRLEMTTDGGASWQPQPGGGAIKLETFNGNVVRLVAASADGCPGPCGVRAEYASVGGANWTTSDLGPLDGGGFQLVRSDADVYVLATGNWAGGAPARSTLYASTDDGAHWSRHAEPCPQLGREVDSHSIAASPGGVVTALCVPRPSAPAFVMVSTDAGAHFARRAGTIPWQDAGSIAGDPSTVLVVAGNRSHRSTDGGASWSPIADVPREATFVGFENPTVGRMITEPGNAVWTTTDGGARWRSFTFPS